MVTACRGGAGVRPSSPDQTNIREIVAALLDQPSLELNHVLHNLMRGKRLGYATEILQRLFHSSAAEQDSTRRTTLFSLLRFLYKQRCVEKTDLLTIVQKPDNDISWEGRAADVNTWIDLIITHINNSHANTPDDPPVLQAIAANPPRQKIVLPLSPPPLPLVATPLLERFHIWLADWSCSWDLVLKVLASVAYIFIAPTLIIIDGYTPSDKL